MRGKIMRNIGFLIIGIIGLFISFYITVVDKNILGIYFLIPSVVALSIYKAGMLKKSQCNQLLDIWEGRGDIDKKDRIEYEQMWGL